MRTPIALLLFLLVACTGDTEKQPQRTDNTNAVKQQDRTAERLAEARSRYDAAAYFPGDQRDTMLTNMVTFIYKRPALATQATRTNPEFRPYYVENTRHFRWVYHHMTPDSTHWFYLLRPARSLEGSLRGVGGRFRTNDRLELTAFEELFNTRVLAEDVLLDKGLVLFEEMLSTGTVDAYLEDRGLIEWPDDRLKYDQEMREWRYVD